MAKINSQEEAERVDVRHLQHCKSIIIDSHGHIYANQKEEVVKAQAGKKDKLFIVK